MKRIITLFVLLTTTLIYSQSSGITYQAVLYNPSGEILPGNNNANAVLSNKDICLRFSITDSQTSLEYQETQRVTTDEFGMVNLVIGSGNQIGGYATNFNAIVWNSTTKKLQVAIDVAGSCSNFVEISNQNFSAVPFAYASKTAESVSGVVPIVNGGTGSSTVSGAKTNLGLNNVDNTSDVNKPISNDTQTALNLKENTANKSTNTALGTSDVLFPTQNAVKTYVDSQLSSGVVDATSTIKGKIKLAGDLTGTADLPIIANSAINSSKIANGAVTDTKITSVSSSKVIGSIPVSQINGAVSKVNGVLPNGDGSVVIPFGMVRTGTLALRPNVGTTTNGDIYVVSGDSNANNNGLTYISDGQNWNEVTPNQASLDARYLKLGGGTMSGNIIVPAGKFISINDVPTSSTDAANKAYVDSMITGGATPDATTISLGKIQLVGDLGGTATSPTVPGLASKEPTITSGTTSQYFRGDKTWQTLDKTALGLGNVDNTSDASKPISTAMQTALNAKENTIAAGTTAQYYRGDKTWQTLDKTAVGLNNVNDTSDASKPISTDTQNALDLKANLASPTFTGDAKAATATTGDNDTSIATTAFVSTAITNAATPNATTATVGKIQLGGDLAGTGTTATAPVISNDAITTLKIADNAVTNAKLGETISVANGGTGATSLTGYIKGNGTSAFTSVSSIPVAHVDGAVSSVNGVAPVNGNVSVLLGRVFQGDNVDPTLATSVTDINNDTNLLNNTKESDIYIVVGNSNNANNGRTFIFNGTTWLEVATNLAATDSRYVNITGDILEGNLEVPTTKKIIIADAPSNATDAANKAYVDTKIGGSGTTNYVPKFLGTSPSNTLTNSSIFDDGTKVGIGTTTPSSTLHIQNPLAATNTVNVNAKVLTLSRPATFSTKWDNIAQFNLGSYAVASASTDAANTRLDLDLNDGSGITTSNIMTWQANGNVGIGTNAPASKLDVRAGITSVNSTINATGSINDFLQYNIQNTSTGPQAQSGYSATADNGNATSGFAWLGINNSGFNYPTAYNIGGANDVSFVGSGQDMYLANANNTKSIIFSTGKSTTPFFNEQMRILNNGNVGIGTNVPANKLEIKQGTAGNSGLRFTNLNSSSTATTSASKVLGLNSTGDVILTNIPGTQNIVSFSTANPNTGSPVFTPNTPTDQSVIYQSATDNSLWTYNGTTYVTYTAPATTAWNLSGTTNDAGGTKISSISRTGNVGVGISSPSAKFHVNTPSGTNNVARFTTEGTGTNWATIGLGNASGAWSSIAAGDSKFQIRNFSTDATILHADLTSGNVGIGTTTPSKILDVVNQTSGHIGVIEAEGPVTSSYSRAMAIRMRRGTLTSPSALQSNDVSAFAFAGYDGSAYSTSAAGLAGLATENWNSTNKGMALTLSTTQNATSTLLERMRIDHNGNIGIGTTAPTGTFEIATNNGLSSIIRRGGATAQTPANLILQKTSGADAATHGAVVNGDFVGRILFSASNGSSYLTNGTDIVGYAAGTQSLTNNGGGIFFRTVPQGSVAQSVERMRIEHNGNVGIGTASPTTNLDVVGGFSLRNTTGAAGSNYGIEFNTNASSPRIDWVYNGGYTGSFAGDSDFFLRLQNSKQGSGGFRFMTNPSGAAIERMTILNNGNIGIGMTNPTALLEISSTAASGVAPKLRLNNPNGKKWELQSGISGVSDASFGIYNVTDNLQVLTAKATGEVGIGTSTPDASAKLDLTATNKGFLPPRVTLTGTADVSTIATPATGLLVYNTATAGTSPAAVQPGYYYYNGTRWVPLAIPGGANVNIQTGAYTLTDNDSKGVVIVNSASNINVTVPATLPAGFFCQIIQKGAGTVTVSGASGVTIQSANGLTTRAQYSSIGLIMESSTTGYVSGDSGL